MMMMMNEMANSQFSNVTQRSWTYCTFSDIYQDWTKTFVTGCRSVIQHSAPVPPLHQQVNIVGIFSCFCKLVVLVVIGSSGHNCIVNWVTGI